MLVAPELQSERLIYRDITEEDAKLIVKWRSNPEVYRYFSTPHEITLQEHLNWFRSSYVCNENRFDWIAHNNQKQPIGIFGLRRNDRESVEAEVSYILNPDFYGKGYAAEAVRRLLVFCSEEWRCKKVTAEIHNNNQKSIVFAEKLGFSKEKENENFSIYSFELPAALHSPCKESKIQHCQSDKN